MLQVPDPRKFVEGLIEGLLGFVIAVVRSWLAVIVRPARGALRLAADPQALSSKSVLFLACIVPGAVSNLGMSNLARIMQGGALTPIDPNNPWYTSYDQSGGLWFYVIWALLTFAIYEILSQFLAWMFSDGLSARRRLRLHMLRHVFAAMMIIEAMVRLADIPFINDDVIFALQQFLLKMVLSYPLFLVILVFARRMKRAWTRLFIAALVLVTLYPIVRGASEKLVEPVLVSMFMPKMNASVEALQCSVVEGGLRVEAILLNQGSRPIAIDRRFIGVRVVGLGWAGTTPSGYEEPELVLDPETMQARVREGEILPQTLTFDPGQLEVLGPNATLRFTGLAKGPVKLHPVFPSFCRLETGEGRLGVRSANALVLREPVAAGTEGGTPAR